jgi:iron complex transport system substrate-binding protein
MEVNGLWLEENSNSAHFISDANAEYILKDNTDQKAVTMSFEEVFAKSKKYSIG